MNPQTETVLLNWRNGSLQAERLCAAILHSEGYDSVDPQCPLGGPDGLKDVLCEKSGQRYVAACYFPTSNKNFTDIKEKLLHDKEGVSVNKADGLVFFVNQFVSPSERAELSRLVEPNRLELYHLERIRAILDAPKGYGIRLQFLRISMSPEEQLSLLSVINFRVDERLKEQSRELAAIKYSLQNIHLRTNTLIGAISHQPSSIDSKQIQVANFPTSGITLSTLSWVHRLIMENSGMPLATRGVLRDAEVWLAAEGKGREDAELVPPPPAQVPGMIEKLLSEWSSNYDSLVGNSKEDIIQALAEFHHRLLYIHPFIDGNGRLARAVLQQQCFELLGQWVAAEFTSEPAIYYNTLRQADNGDIEPLCRLISANLE